VNIEDRRLGIRLFLQQNIAKVSERIPQDLISKIQNDENNKIISGINRYIILTISESYETHIARLFLKEIIWNLILRNECYTVKSFNNNGVKIILALIYVNPDAKIWFFSGILFEIGLKNFVEHLKYLFNILWKDNEILNNYTPDKIILINKKFKTAIKILEKQK
jgi:hypothetical protein